MAKQGQPRGYTIGDDARREISDMLAWFKRHNGGGGNLPGEPFTKFGPRTVRWAKCAVNDICASYPAAPANTFPIIFGELEFDDTECGQKERTFTPYEPEDGRVAHDANDVYHAEDDIVLVFMSHGKWYISSQPIMFAEAILGEDMCGDEEEVDIGTVKGIPGCNTLSITAATNPRSHAGPSGSNILLINKKCSAADNTWQIFDIEKQEACFYVMIEDRESCLVGQGLKGRHEWCTFNEPDAVCAIVDYTDCETEMPACDLEWVFNPLFACC